MATRAFVFLRPLPARAAHYRQRHPYGPTAAGGFETALSVEIDARQLAPYADALAATDGLARFLPITLTGALVLLPAPRAQQDVAATLGLRGTLAFVYRHLDVAAVTTAATATIQALGPQRFPSPQTPLALGAAFARGDFWLSVAGGATLGQASTHASAPGWAEIGFEIVFLPGGLDLSSGGAPAAGAPADPGWLRLQDLVEPTAETRRLDPMAFYAAAAAGAGPATLDASHASHALLTLATRRTLIEVRDEVDAPYAGPVTIVRGAVAPATAPAPAGARGTFVVDEQPPVGPPASLVYVVSAPDQVFTDLPSGDAAEAAPTRTLQPPAHWALQTVYMSAAPALADESHSWFVANTGGLPRFTERNLVTPYRDGVEALGDMARAIRTLTAPAHYLYLAAWALVDDFELIPGDAASTFRQLATDASGRGARVRALLYDDTTFRAGFPWVGSGNQNTAPVNRINALANGRAILDNELPGPFASHHQKLLVVSGSGGGVAFCGGMDVNADRMDSPEHGALGAFHDVHARVEGPAVADIHRTFQQRWNDHPQTVANPGTGLPAPPPPFAPAPGSAFVQVARTYSPRHTRAGHYAFVAPDGSLTPLDALRRAIQRARHYIYIEDQYLTPYAGTTPYAAAGDATGVVGDLIAALARIQHLIVVVPNHCDQPQNRYRRQQLISVLLDAAPHKVEVYYLARAGAGASPRPGETATTGGCPDCSGGAAYRREIYVHSKVWIVDDVAAKIGTANVNRRSLTSDTEIDLVVVDGALDNGARRFARRLRMDLWAEHLNLGSARRALVEDVELAVQLFRRPPAGARIRPYDHNAEVTPPGMRGQGHWDGEVDADGR